MNAPTAFSPLGRPFLRSLFSPLGRPFLRSLFTPSEGPSPDPSSHPSDAPSPPPKARSLWLLGVCGQNLTNADLWCGAYQLVVQHMASKDLVVSGVAGRQGRTINELEDFIPLVTVLSQPALPTLPPPPPHTNPCAHLRSPSPPCPAPSRSRPPSWTTSRRWSTTLPPTSPSRGACLTSWRYSCTRRRWQRRRGRTQTVGSGGEGRGGEGKGGEGRGGEVGSRQTRCRCI